MGLTNGTAYTFSVHAGNAIGTGTESARSSAVTPATVPGAPTVVSVDARDGRVTVSWSAPAGTGGAAITGYTVTAAPGGATATTDGTTHTADVTGLVNGTAYTFTVTATNSVGTGPASGASAAATPTADLAVVIATVHYGYWMLGSDGTVYGFGDATPSPGASPPARPPPCTSSRPRAPMGTGSSTTSATSPISATPATSAA